MRIGASVLSRLPSREPVRFVFARLLKQKLCQFKKIFSKNIILDKGTACYASILGKITMSDFFQNRSTRFDSVRSFLPTALSFCANIGSTTAPVVSELKLELF